MKLFPLTIMVRQALKKLARLRDIVVFPLIVSRVVEDCSLVCQVLPVKSPLYTYESLPFSFEI